MNSVRTSTVQKSTFAASGCKAVSWLRISMEKPPRRCCRHYSFHPRKGSHWARRRALLTDMSFHAACCRFPIQWFHISGASSVTRSSTQLHFKSLCAFKYPDVLFCTFLLAPNGVLFRIHLEWDWKLNLLSHTFINAKCTNPVMVLDGLQSDHANQPWRRATYKNYILCVTSR